jgi:hypothetical protein
MAGVETAHTEGKGGGGVWRWLGRGAEEQRRKGKGGKGAIADFGFRISNLPLTQL